MIDKRYDDVAEVVARIPDGASVGVGGFGASGSPTRLCAALLELGVRDLHIVSNNLGVDGTAFGRLFSEGRVRKFTGSFPGPGVVGPLFSGDLELELVPQGSLAERLRAAGVGIPAFYSRSSAHTVLATGEYPSRYDPDGRPVAFMPAKESREFGAATAVLEHALPVDFGFVRAHRADRLGNLVFRGAARNFNPLVAMAARTTIVEAEQLVDAGGIDPGDIHVPGIYVDAVVEADAAREAA